MRGLSKVIGALAMIGGAAWAGSVLRVGPGEAYSSPCAAITAAQDGDTVEVDAGTYLDEACTFTKNGLTVRGVNGRPKLVAPSTIPNGKGILVQYGADFTVEGIEFTGARLPVDKNGAGIRSQGGNLTIRDCWFHDNDDGILVGTADPDAGVLIENSEFSANGAGDGYSHNIYVSTPTAWFVMRGSYSHDSVVGHLVKSRARENWLIANRLTSEQGTTSYEVDLPNGGTSVLVGNMIEQGPNGQNTTVVSYGAEGIPGTHRDDLYVVNNTMLNDRGSGVFVSVASGVQTAAKLRNNLFRGGASLVAVGKVDMVSNLPTQHDLFVDAGGFDYHLKSTSAEAIDQGVDPGTTADGGSLTPALQYVHPTHTEARPVAGALDYGAFEVPGEPDGGTTTPPGPHCGCDAAGALPFAALALLALRRRRATRTIPRGHGTRRRAS